MREINVKMRRVGNTGAMTTDVMYDLSTGLPIPFVEKLDIHLTIEWPYKATMYVKDKEPEEVSVLFSYPF